MAHGSSTVDVGMTSRHELHCRSNRYAQSYHREAPDAPPNVAGLGLKSFDISLEGAKWARKELLEDPRFVPFGELPNGLGRGAPVIGLDKVGTNREGASQDQANDDPEAHPPIDAV